jgi:hypothetical protein
MVYQRAARYAWPSHACTQAVGGSRKRGVQKNVKLESHQSHTKFGSCSLRQNEEQNEATWALSRVSAALAWLWVDGRGFYTITNVLCAHVVSNELCFVA